MIVIILDLIKVLLMLCLWWKNTLWKFLLLGCW